MNFTSSSTTHKNLPTGMFTVGIGERHSFETNALSAEDTGRHYLSSCERVTVGFHHQQDNTQIYCRNQPDVVPMDPNLLLRNGCTLTWPFQELLEPARLNRVTNVCFLYVPVHYPLLHHTLSYYIMVLSSNHKKAERCTPMKYNIFKG
jgi:hypothetical protein